jgi:hypothetical protein
MAWALLIFREGLKGASVAGSLSAFDTHDLIFDKAFMSLKWQTAFAVVGGEQKAHLVGGGLH